MINIMWRKDIHDMEEQFQYLVGANLTPLKSSFNGFLPKLETSDVVQSVTAHPQTDRSMHKLILVTHRTTKPGPAERPCRCTRQGGLRSHGKGDRRQYVLYFNRYQHDVEPEDVVVGDDILMCCGFDVRRKMAIWVKDLVNLAKQRREQLLVKTTLEEALEQPQTVFSRALVQNHSLGEMRMLHLVAGFAGIPMLDLRKWLPEPQIKPHLLPELELGQVRRNYAKIRNLKQRRLARLKRLLA